MRMCWDKVVIVGIGTGKRAEEADQTCCILQVRKLNSNRFTQWHT